MIFLNQLKQLNLILFFLSLKKNKKIINKNLKIEIIKKVNKKKHKINCLKSKRFDKKNLLIILKDKKNLIGSGWIYYGKGKWLISEINKIITIKNYYLLYDFVIIKKYRNMGYYTDFLKLIKKKFTNKLCIYTTVNNFKSFRGIKSSGFSLQKIVSKFFTINI